MKKIELLAFKRISGGSTKKDQVGKFRMEECEELFSYPTALTPSVLDALYTSSSVSEICVL